ncbi:MAG: MBL fold metallo-hydrolase [Chloroflexota bacterium]|jgi:hydroxyacylglutathione hydrolase
MIDILQLPLGPLQTNCYILACQETMKAAVIDPSWNGQAIVATLEERGYEISHILLTHSHFDHVGGLADLKQETAVPIYIHPEAVTMLSMANQAAGHWGMTIPEPPAADEMLSDGQTLTVGNITLEVLYTPGHAPGHVAFYLPDYQIVFSGDALFQQSIGRTDLPGGDMDTLLSSIRQKLLPLPDETQVLSGHGPATTIGNEKKGNPFLKE